MSANAVSTGTAATSTDYWYISADSINGTSSPSPCFATTAADYTISNWWNQAGYPIFSNAYRDLTVFISDVEKAELESDFEIAPVCLLELVRKITEDHEFREKLEQSMAYLLLKSSHISVWMLSVCLEKASSLDSKQEEDETNG